MLQYNAIDKRALELLRKMMAEPRLNAYNLVGGTALALQMGIVFRLIWICLLMPTHSIKKSCIKHLSNLAFFK